MVWDQLCCDATRCHLAQGCWTLSKKGHHGSVYINHDLAESGAPVGILDTPVNECMKANLSGYLKLPGIGVIP